MPITIVALLSVVSLAALLSAVLLCFLISNPTHPISAPKIEISGDSGSTAVYQHGKIPKIIWSYWHSKDLPLVVERCLRNWKTLNPDYEIRMLHAENVKEFLPEIPQALTQVGIPKQTDWIRLVLLHRYGGFWVDASIFMTESLDWAHQLYVDSAVEFVGFYLEGYGNQELLPVIESWFLAAAPQSPFIADWWTVFDSQVIKAGTETYLQNLHNAGVYKQLVQKIGDPRYHTIHVAAQQVLQSGVSISQTAPKSYSLALIRAEDSAYAYHVQSRWKRLRLYVRLLWNTESSDKPMLIKLRGRERKKLEPYLRKKWYRHASLVGRHLG